jgi:hypothetical protein
LEYAVGDFRCTGYLRADGTALAGSGGGSNHEYQTAITTNTSYGAGDKAINKVIPVTGDNIEVTINKSTWTLDEMLIFEPRGADFKVLTGTDARIYGERNLANEHIARNPHTLISVTCMGLNGSIMEYACQGAKKLGYTGAVTTTSYIGELKEYAVGVDVTVLGTGFSSNMETPIVSANATLNSWVYVSPNEITLNLDAVGTATQTVTVTYRNPDIFVDIDAITIATEPLSVGLQRWFKMEETSGTDAIDTQGNGNGTYTGSPTLNQTGKVGQCPTFNGTSAYVDFVSPQSWGITADGWTISCWFNKTSLAATQIIFSKGTATNVQIQAHVNTSGNLLITLGDNTGSGTPNIKQYTYNSVISAGTWYSLVLRVTSITSIGVRLNNVPKTPDSTTGSATFIEYASNGMQIGNRDNGLFWGGKIDEVCAWTRLLTDTECDDKYTNENAGNPMY